MKQIFKINILVFCGIIFTYILFQSYHSDNIFKYFFYLIFGGAAISITYIELFDKKNNFKNLENIKSNSIILIGIFFILLNLSVICFYQYKLGIKTLIKAEGSGTSIDLKVDKTYVLKTGSWASKKYYYGNYSLNDSLLIFDRKSFNDEIISNCFVIRNYVDNSHKYIVQIDRHGKEIKNILSYDIHPTKETYISDKYDVIEDNRK